MNFTNSWILTLACTLISIVFSVPALSQNIVPNPDFEVFTMCPESFGTGGTLPAAPWQNANMGSSDYFHACGLQDWTTVPHNALGFEEAHSGIAYAGGFYLANEFREYLQTPFTEPMDPGFNYLVSFYINMAEDVSGCGIADFGVYFSDSPLMDPASYVIPVTPQLTTNGEYYTDNAGWMLFTACYSPAGGEQWMTIGNFNSDSNTPVDPSCTGLHTTYYFIDDVYVIKGGNLNGINFDLGDAVSACNTYTIDPGLSGVSYLWSNGSTGSLLTVTESGVYYLTVSDECLGGIDSVTVTIFIDNPVDIGPDTTGLCNGDTYQISLDPGAGIYTWQDGSNATTYDILQAGEFYVTLDNGDCISSDTIVVEIDQPPPSFSLGADTALCAGESIIIDPVLSGLDFEWQDGSTDPTFLATDPGDISLTVINSCGTSSDTINVNFIDPPVPFDLGSDTFICQGGSILLEASQPDVIATWQDGSHLPFYLADEAGDYTLTLSNQCGIQTDALTVDFDMQLIELDDDTVIVWCPGESLLLDVQQTFDADYSWSTGSVDHEILVDAPGTFVVTINTPCRQETQSYEVIAVPDCAGTTGVYIPDAFSPNGDGFNDEFMIGLSSDLVLADFECQVFDRWGNQVFFSKAYPSVWNGKFADSEMNPGVYVYLIRLTHVVSGVNQNKTYSGSITLIR